MSILDEARKESSPSRVGRCKVGKWILDLPDDLTDEVTEALDAPDVTSAALHRVLKPHGLVCASTTLIDHRRHVCACYS